MNNIIDKVAWINIKNKKVLGARSKNKIPFYIPGGKREADETDLETLVREIKEELKINIKTETVEFFGTFKAQAHGKSEGFLVIMRCYTADFEGKIEPNSEIEEIGWLTSKDIDIPIVSPVDNLILTDLKNKNLID